MCFEWGPPEPEIEKKDAHTVNGACRSLFAPFFDWSHVHSAVAATNTRMSEVKETQKRLAYLMQPLITSYTVA